MATNNLINTANPSGVSAGSYTNTNLTVNAAGLVTAVSNGTGGVSPILARVYLGSVQTISTLTQLHFNTVSFDTNSFYNTGTYQYLPTVSGKYKVTLNCEVSNTSSTAFTASLYIYKNASIYVTAQIANTGTLSSHVGVIAEAIISMNGSTDYISFYAVSSANESFAGSPIASYVTFVYLGA